MTQSNPLRVGLIGAGGRWGPSAHVPALKGVSEAELYAVCTAHADTAQAAADKLGVSRAYGNDKALNADAEVEAVLSRCACRRTTSLRKTPLKRASTSTANGPSARIRKRPKSSRRWRARKTCAPWPACSVALRPPICTCAS